MNGLVDLGARAIIAMTFHGSPLHEHAIEGGCEAVRKRGARALNPMNLLLDLLINVDGERFAPAVAHVDDAAVRARLLELIPVDFHAGFFETSMTMHYAPASVSPAHAQLPPCPALPLDAVFDRLEKGARALGRTRFADELLLAARSQGWSTLRPFPGYTSSPSYASAASGAYFADQILGLYAPVVRGVVEGTQTAPAPVMPWVLWATLGGRVEAAKRVELRDVAA
jgi:creatinine amidohydrolase